MPDTLKGQHIFKLTAPYCLHSDMGRILVSIITDTCGWHDTVCGVSDAEQVKAKYGELSYQEGRHDFYRSGQECFLIDLAKWGLGLRDIVPNINFFSKVTTSEQGDLLFNEQHSQAGSYVELRFEIDTLGDCCKSS